MFHQALSLGSILGPLLFLLFINHMHGCKPSKLSLFSDDAKCHRKFIITVNYLGMIKIVYMIMENVAK